MSNSSTGLDRRTAIGLGALALLTPACATAQSGPAATQSAEAQPDAAPEIMRLWPGRPPGSLETLPQERIEERVQFGVTNRVVVGVAEPHIAIVRPPSPNGALLLLMPGGGYFEEWFEKEGYEIAQRFAPQGITSAILRYRLPGEGWAEPSLAPLQDAQRAVRLIRANASALDIDPERICAMGFSAGGHLAASVSTRRTPVYEAIDDADVGSTQPNLTALAYSLIDFGLVENGPSLGTPEATRGIEEFLAYAPNRVVDEVTPPAFIVQAADDFLGVDQSFAYAAALRAKSIGVELHMFEEGGHGFGVREAEKPVKAWPDLFLAWAGRHGFLELA